MKEHEIIRMVEGQEVKTIVNFLENKEFTAVQLIQALKNKKKQGGQDVFTPQRLNKIALKYDKRGNEADAFIIYQYAAELGEADAAANVAMYYFEGLSPCAKDLKAAADFCGKAIANGCVDRNILMAQIHAENEEYLKAIKCLKLIMENPAYANTEMDKEARLLEKDIMMRKLEGLYERVNNPVLHISGTLSAMHLTKSKKFGWEELKDNAEIDALDEKVYQEMSDKIKELEFKAKTDQSLQLKGRLATAQTAFASYSADKEKILIQRQVQTENHFFNPRRTKNQRALQLAKELGKRRLNEAELPVLTIGAQGANCLSGPARQFITAERSTVQMSVEIDPHTRGCTYPGYKHKIGWKHNPNPQPPIPGKRDDADYAYYETVNFFGTTIKYCQRVNSHKNHLGDYYLRDAFDYAKIIKIIDNITENNVAAEKDMAKLMLNFVHDGAPVDLPSLHTIKQNVTQKDLDDLNRIFYHCFIKEVARWMLPTEETHNLPLATAQARALQLIINGNLRMRDVFAKDALYGVYTGVNIGSNIPRLKGKIKEINDKYEACILQNLPSYQNFMRQNPNGKIISSRHGLRAELRKTFGGEADTDGEGYDSDNQRETLYKTVMG